MDTDVLNYGAAVKVLREYSLEHGCSSRLEVVSSGSWRARIMDYRAWDSYVSDPDPLKAALRAVAAATAARAKGDG